MYIYFNCKKQKVLALMVTFPETDWLSFLIESVFTRSFGSPGTNQSLISGEMFTPQPVNKLLADNTPPLSLTALPCLHMECLAWHRYFKTCGELWVSGVFKYDPGHGRFWVILLHRENGFRSIHYMQTGEQILCNNSEPCWKIKIPFAALYIGGLWREPCRPAETL